MLDIRQLILELRPDLRQMFGIEQTNASNDIFSAWLLTSGVKEYAALYDAPGLFAHLQTPGNGPNGKLTLLQHLIWIGRPDVQKAFPLPQNTTQYLAWFYTYGLEEHGFWRFLSTDEHAYVLQLPEPWQTRIKAVIPTMNGLPRSDVPLRNRPFGVNLIGYVFGQLGIGEDVRMAARALLKAEVPMTMVNFQPGADIPQNDHSMASHVSADGVFAINVFCMTALETGRYYAERGSKQFANRYNIGYWPWELGKWPKQWEPMVDLVDEVWVSSRHTFDALVAACSIPVFLMPMAVELGPITEFAGFRQAREFFGLPTQPRLFCFSFDLNSSFHRKNPQACVDAFLQAFPKDEFSGQDVGLVIKVHRPARRHLAWEKLKRLARVDERIHIVEQTLSRPDLLALYKACDCFLSLHRAEGFGRGIAEALQLGMHVIVTDYSGNVDFCHPPTADLVRHSLVKVKKGQYPYGDGQQWANVDVAHAAELMRKFAGSRKKQSKSIEWQCFSALTVGERYRQRLLEIWNARVITVGIESGWI